MSTRREFLLLADTFKADKHDPVGMLMSEKLDGNRCFWDGGVSRGDDTLNVPWASVTDPKTGEQKAKIKPKATGLWSRYGNPVNAPDWFLDALPPEPLDGELYLGRDQFQDTQKIVRKEDWTQVEDGWRKMQYKAFGAPVLRTVFQNGLIKNPNMLQEINLNHCIEYYAARLGGSPLDQCRVLADSLDAEPRSFLEELDVLTDLYGSYGGDVFDIVEQKVCESLVECLTICGDITKQGGEGVMLRCPEAVWFPKRKPLLLKVKPRYDAEATIVGFYGGKKGKTGHLHGRIGGLIAVWHGSADGPSGLFKAPVEFEIGTGLTHADREVFSEHFETTKAHQGVPIPNVTATPTFKVGDRVTFSYMGVTKDLSPREPAYMRLREDS